MSQVVNEPDSTTGEGVAPSTAVTEAVSARAGAPVSELPPLNEVVDPDALNTLFVDRGAGGSVEFQYAGCRVTVHADHTIEVSETQPG